MDPAKQREIASKGGKAAHQKGTAHEFTPEEAREAGRKGGRSARSSSSAATASNVPAATPTPEMAGVSLGTSTPPSTTI